MNNVHLDYFRKQFQKLSDKLSKMSGDEDDRSPVQLYIYDLSRNYSGVLQTLSTYFIGQPLDGIWHTSIVVYGKEYFFGQQGISCCEPQATVLGAPLKIEDLGETFVPYSVFIDFINGLNESSYAGSTYHLFTHNCNNFSNELAQFLCGKEIPEYILALPNQVLNTPFGQQLQGIIERLQFGINISSISRVRSPSPSLQALNQQIEEARSDSTDKKKK